MSTTQLVVASKGGDNEALGRLLEQYRGYLLMLAHRYLSERLRRRVDPADIVQLTYLEAKRDLPAFRGETPAEFAGWLRGMLKNNVATAVTRFFNSLSFPQTAFNTAPESPFPDPPALPAPHTPPHSPIPT